MIERYAAVVCDWSLEVGPGTRLLVDGPLEAKALATAVAAHAWRAGATVSVNLNPSWSSGLGVSEELDAAFDAACEIHLGGWMFSDHYVSKLRRVRCTWPTALAAQGKGVGTLKLAETIFAGCLLDRSDPLVAWRQVAERNERAIARLATASRISVGGEELAISGVEWEHEAGRTELPGAFVRAELGGGALHFATHTAELSASLAGRDVDGAIALDGVEVTAW